MGDTLISMVMELSTNNTQLKLCDKGQLVVILSRTQIGKHTSFVGDKNNILTGLKEIILSKAQFTDYKETVLDTITINSRNEIYIPLVMIQEIYLFHMIDVTLPQFRARFVFNFMSLRCSNIYIRQTACVCQRIQREWIKYNTI